MDALTLVESAEVLVGIVALEYAIHLQFLVRADNPYAVGVFYALGSSMVLTHMGGFLNVCGIGSKVYIDAVAITVVFVGMTAVWVRVSRQETEKEQRRWWNP